MISLIIPHVSGVPGADDILKESVDSWNKQYDELIIVTNDGTGYGKAVNLGMRLAKNDYLVISNNDVKRVYGSLREFEGINWAITTTSITPAPRDHLPRSFFCVPRKIYEYFLLKDGYFFDERFKYYFEDDDLHKRMVLYGIERFFINDISVHHLNGGGMTCKHFGEQSGFDESKKKFEEKWG